MTATVPYTVTVPKTTHKRDVRFEMRLTQEASDLLDKLTATIGASKALAAEIAIREACQRRGIETEKPASE